MTKKILIWIGIFFVFLIYLTPARLVANLLPANAPVSLSGLSGSVWDGHLEQVSAQNLNLKDVEFSLNLLDTLMFSPSVDIDIANGDMVGDLRVYLTGDMARQLKVEAVNLELDAARMGDTIRMRGVDIGGDLLTESFAATSENNKFSLLEGKLHWRKSMVNVTGEPLNLGDFSIDFNTDENNIIVGNILPTKNALKLQGKVTIKPNGEVEFIGSIPTNIEQNLYNALVLFNDGKPAGGRLPLKFKQRVF